MKLLASKDLSQSLRAQIKSRTADITKRLGRAPSLAVILVGQDPASQVYVKNKIRACEEAGINSSQLCFPAEVPAASLADKIKALNADPKIDAILLQLPLPKGLDASSLIQLIDPKKDPDALTLENQGLLFQGRPRVKPCTPNGVIEILKYNKVPLSGAFAVVLGRSQIVGRPMAELLLQEDATVVVAHSKTKNLSHLTMQADILVVAVGKARMIGREHVKPGAIVIDVGIHKGKDGKLSGDVRMEELEGVALGCTPVPGGVGPMTITMLLANTLSLAEARLK